MVLLEADPITTRLLGDDVAGSRTL